MKKFAFVVAIFSISFAFGGCARYSEPDTLGIVSGIAIEKNGNEFTVFCELANVHGSDLAATQHIESGSGSTISLAMAECENRLGKPLYLAHIQTIVAAESLAQTGILEVSAYINLINEIPLSVNLIAAPNMHAEEIWQNESKGKNINESIKSFALAKTCKGEIGGAIDMPFYKFYRRLTLKNGTATLPMLEDGILCGTANYKNNAIISYTEKN